jgi:hypothetical protein
VKTLNRIRKQQKERGIALLISIFILLLISVVAIALIVSSGTETALAGNYRSATGVYYAGQAGLEEARGRLYPKNPSSFQNTAPGFLPSSGVALAVGSVAYVLNPSPGEASGTLRATYPDTEYDNEFGPGSLAGATVTTTSSVWSTAPLSALGVPGPLYKWVRINAVTEKSLNVLVAPYNPGPLDSTMPVFYDGTQLNITNSGAQVLEITSLAVLPNGSQKIVQYLVASSAISMPPFPAAITLLGNNVDYTGPFANSWNVSGNDTISLGSCTPGASVWAIGYYNNGDLSGSNITSSGAVATSPYKNNYTGAGGVIPNVGYIGGSIPPAFQKPSQLDALAQSITQNADVVISGPATGASLPPGMSPSNLMTVVVNGNLDLTGWHNQGYGLLLVTGNLTYDPDASWYGVVLLIGQGTMAGSRSGTGQLVGAVFLAKTRNPSGALFPDPNLPSAADPSAPRGTPDFYGSNIQFSSSMGGQGIYYSSCWINAALPTGQYNILSFHEISQP